MGKVLYILTPVDNINMCKSYKGVSMNSIFNTGDVYKLCVSRSDHSVITLELT